MFTTLFLATLALVSASPTPRGRPTRFYYKPFASDTLCLAGMDGSGASVDGCGNSFGFQEWELNNGQLKLTSGGYDLCLAPESWSAGAAVIGHVCTAGQYNSWEEGPRPGTIAWKGLCLDNTFGRTDEGNPVQVYRCSTYHNKNQIWHKVPAPSF